MVLEQWLRLLALYFLTLKPNSICPIKLHHLANNILLSFQLDKLYLSLRLSFYLMVIYAFEVFWLWPTKVNSFFLVSLVVLWGFLMWVFWIRFIYKVCVSGFASKLFSLLWFCDCVLFLHHVIFENLRFCYVGLNFDLYMRYL